MHYEKQRKSRNDIFCGTCKGNNTSLRLPVLFSSHAGVSRSVAIVTAYLMKTNHLTFQEAYAFVQAIKPDAKYDLFFLWQKCFLMKVKIYIL